MPGVDWLKAQLCVNQLGEPERKSLLAGRAPDGVDDAGPVICACFGVGFSAIQSLIANGKAVSVEAVGEHLKAGTNCGSCQPEIKKLIKTTVGKRSLAGSTG